MPRSRVIMLAVITAVALAVVGIGFALSHAF